MAPRKPKDAPTPPGPETPAAGTAETGVSAPGPVSEEPRAKDHRPSGDPAFLSVVAPAGRRRRAGIEFGSDPVLVALADLTDDQLLAIHGDPALQVEPVADR